MTFQVTFKTPDALENAVDQEVEYELNTLEDEYQDDENRDSIKAGLMKFAQKWVRYNEYVTLEFDTVADTVTVLKTGK